jgi:hypothetical protein
MTAYSITAVDLRTSFQVQATIQNVDVRSAMAEFLSSFPNTRITSAKPQ